MATAFSKVYESFLDKVTDYDLAEMTVESADAIMHSLLNYAIVRFSESCKKDLSQVTAEDEFVEDLSLTEIDILGEGMVVAWLKPYHNNYDLLHNSLNTKDFTTFSPANLLDKINDAYKMARANFIARIKEYSYIQNDVGDLV